MTDSYGKAWYAVGQIIFFTDWTRLCYQGKVDVTEHIGFAKIAEDYGLSDKQYNALIDKAQKRVDKKLRTALSIPEAQCPAIAIGQS